MKDQHTKIKGYRDLSQEEIDLMNEAKQIATQVGKLVEKIKSESSTDMKWADDGELNLQKGFMSLIRSVAKPTTF